MGVVDLRCPGGGLVVAGDLDRAVGADMDQHDLLRSADTVDPHRSATLTVDWDLCSIFGRSVTIPT